MATIRAHGCAHLGVRRRLPAFLSRTRRSRQRAAAADHELRPVRASGVDRGGRGERRHRRIVARRAQDFALQRRQDQPSQFRRERQRPQGGRRYASPTRPSHSPPMQTTRKPRHFAKIFPASRLLRSPADPLIPIPRMQGFDFDVAVAVDDEDDLTRGPDGDRAGVAGRASNLTGLIEEVAVVETPRRRDERSGSSWQTRASPTDPSTTLSTPR